MAYAVPPESDTKLCGACRPSYTLGEAAYVGQIPVRRDLTTKKMYDGSTDAPRHDVNWILKACRCCKFTFVFRDMEELCTECQAHHPVGKCPNICEHCGEPAHAHPVMKPTISCKHDSVAIINPKLKMRFC
jgi:hypothetical protein